jgi:hypothetical protein
MHVGIITYQTGHLKTWQVIRKVLTKGYRVTVYAFPFELRPPKPGPARYKDRPDQLIDLDVPSFCRRYGVGYVPVEGWGDEFAACIGAPGQPDSPDVYLHCIAKIVPASFIAGRTILNCHPGLLPQNRGVDAFKWSVVNKWPVGIALHVIDPEIDRGVILRRMRIPVFSTIRSRRSACEPMNSRSTSSAISSITCRTWPRIGPLPMTILAATSSFCLILTRSWSKFRPKSRGALAPRALSPASHLFSQTVLLGTPC